MKLEERALSQAENTILAHNIAFPSGRAAVRKGTRLTQNHLQTLQELGRERVLVAVLAPDDVPENEAALALAEALQTPHLQLSRAAGGRVNFRAETDGVLEIDEDCLLAFNLIPGITLATRNQYAVIGPNQTSTDAATLKVIPYAIPQSDLDKALSIAHPALIQLRPLPKSKRAALLLTGEAAVHDKLRADFEPPIRTRLERLGVKLETVETVLQEVAAIQQAASRLAEHHDLLVIGGQTSIMDADDTTLHALTVAGAEVTVFGAPVEPGNLLSLAYFPRTPVMCAPGCARSLNQNIVDMILPRLVLEDRLTDHDIAKLGLGGLLEDDG